MKYLLSEEENEERAVALEEAARVSQLESSLALARELVLGGYECPAESGKPAVDYRCDDCPIGRLRMNPNVKYLDWHTLCGRKTQFSK